METNGRDEHDLLLRVAIMGEQHQSEVNARIEWQHQHDQTTKLRLGFIDRRIDELELQASRRDDGQRSNVALLVSILSLLIAAYEVFSHIPTH